MRLALTLAVSMAVVPAAVRAQNTVPATGGDITITPIFHAHVQIEHAGKIIHVDPYSKGDLTKTKPGDLVLVTDMHGDHLDPAAIAKVRKAGAPVVMPTAAYHTAEGKVSPHVRGMSNGEVDKVEGLEIEVVPSYNLVRGPGPGRFYHTKGRGNGYIITLGGKRLYFAGDTECTPEVKALKNIDVAFLPMNLPFTMTPVEAADCVKAFQPTIVYPYHYQGQKVEEFARALKGTPNVEVRFGAWYP